MMPWIHYLLIAFETFGFVYFFDSFFDAPKKKYKWIAYLVLFAGAIVIITILVLLLPEYGDIVKSMAITAMLSVVCILFYRVHPMEAVFFSAVNYIILFFVDSTAVCVFGMEETRANHALWVGLRIIWIGLLFIIRRKTSYIKEYLRKARITWTHFGWLPVFSGFIGIYFYYLFLSEVEMPVFYSFVSAGIIVLNIVSLLFIQDSLIKEEKLQQSEIQLQNKQNQLQVFRDMQSLHERQGKKLHDYKKQIVTIEGLIENGDTVSAVRLIKELTKSINVEMSEVNTGHPIVNAVLNQEYKIAKGKGIGMMFSVTEADRIRLGDEDIVVVLGNLLDNAIHESEKIVNSGADAVIQVKMAYMDGEMIITVQNPVYEQVSIDNNEVVSRQTEGHGIGLANVREAVEKYNGSFAISCDENEFTAVAII